MNPRLTAAMAAALIVTACASGSIQRDLAAAIDSAEPGAVLHLDAGRYPGPIVIDKPLTIVGTRGSSIVADDDGPAITIIDTSDVTIRDVLVSGGDSGVLVVRSGEVLLERIEVEQALWHGILAQDAEIVVLDCRVSGLRAPQPQGIEIINSDARPTSTVRGCVIEGPVFEGIVSHVSHVVFEDNEVVGATARGVVITEMSDGSMEGNRVTSSEGNAYFCGDMSVCSIVDNEAEGIAAGDPHRSAGGHGVVVHFHSRAFVDGLTVDGIDGDLLLLMLESELLEEVPALP